MTIHLINAAYPHRCPVCDKGMPFFYDYGRPDEAAGSSPLAHDACYKKLHFIRGSYCMRCGKPLGVHEGEYCSDCRRRKYHFERNIALMTYNEAAQFSLVRFKYFGRREFAEFYVRELIKRHRRELTLLGADAIIPVPLHRKRLSGRGYNQAELLAFKLSDALDIPVESGMLRRVRATRRQKELGPSERVMNVRGALKASLKPGIKKVLLVDDIYTTGSTLEACAQCLIEAGVKQVYTVTVAVGEGFESGNTGKEARPGNKADASGSKAKSSGSRSPARNTRAGTPSP